MNQGKTIPQAIFHRLGRNQVEPAASDVETQRAGAKRAVKGLGKVAGFAAGVVLTVGVGDYILDHAETLNRDFPAEHERNFGELPPENHNQPPEPLTEVSPAEQP